MKRYNITVNGKAYDVAVEELDGGAAPRARCSTTRSRGSSRCRRYQS